MDRLQLLILLLRVYLIFQLRPMTMLLVHFFIISPQKSFLSLLPPEFTQPFLLPLVRFQFICLIPLGFFILLLWAFLLLWALILVLPWHRLFFNRLRKHPHSFLHFYPPFPPSLLSLLALVQALLYSTFLMSFSRTSHTFNSPISFLISFPH